MRRTILIAVALSLLAWAVPAFAGASEITEEGVNIGETAQVEATSTDMAMRNTGLGTLTCESWKVEDELVQNSGTFRMIGKGGETHGCELEGLPMQWPNPLITDVESTVPGEGTLTVSFEWFIEGVISCQFEAHDVPFSYESGSNEISLTPTLLTPSQSACGEEAELLGHLSFSSVAGYPIELN